MRLLYLLAVYLAAALHAAMLCWRALRGGEHGHRLRERFGFGPKIAGQPIWIHAASVGEAQLAGVLVKALRERFADTPVLISTFTVTGASRARAVAPHAAVRYLPYDLPGSVRRFLGRVRPRLALILETELWPTLYRQCRRRNIPVVIASARVSARSARRYGRFGALFAQTLRGVVVAAQTREDADRFGALGAAADRTHVTGNLKFDFAVPSDIAERGARERARYAPSRALWVAGSTHETEEQAVIEAHRRVRETSSDALLVLAPRHPNRFEAVAQWLTARGVAFVRHSRDPASEAVGRAEVLLLDTLGELLTFYAAADAAFVGGSLVPVGGHNLLEPAALGVPVVTGPHQFNGEEVARLLLERGAIAIVRDGAQLGERLSAWLADADLRARVGSSGAQAVQDSRGALERLMRLIEPLLSG